jgi:pyruvate,water dikinase
MVEATVARDQIAALDQATANQPDWASTERILQALADVRRNLAEALRKTPLPAALNLAVQTLPQNEEQWAVRSSATVEDAAQHSYAGLFQSFLSVPRGPRLLEAIREVWLSTFSKNVLHYRAQHGTAMPRMAVLLQPMAPITMHDRAGTAFSHSTIPQLSGVLIQSTYGAGIPVVGGDGGELKCVNEMEVKTLAQRPSHMLVSGEHGELKPLPKRLGQVLTDTAARELAQRVQEIASQYGQPVDVEFFWRQGKDPVFVQVRPITK